MNNNRNKSENIIKLKCCVLSKISIILVTTAIAGTLIFRIYPGETCGLYRAIVMCFYSTLLLLSVLFSLFALLRIKSQKLLKGRKLAIIAFILALFYVCLELSIIPNIRCINHRLMCASNMSGLGKAIFTYSLNDEHNRLPSVANWCDLLLKHTDISEGSFKCEATFLPVFSYGFNKNLDGLKLDGIPSDVVLLFEIQGGKNMSGGQELMVYRHKTKEGYGANVIFSDFTVGFVYHGENLNWGVNSVSDKKP